LAGRAGASLGPLSIGACSAARTIAVEDRLAALKAGAGRLVSGAWDRNGLRHDGRLVDRTGPGLRHHNAARRWRWHWGGCGDGVILYAMCWSMGRGIDDFAFYTCKSLRVNLRYGCGLFQGR
jgi:hypothetical protein